MSLRHSDWGAAELAASLSLTTAEVREALDRLSELSLLRPSASERTRLHPVSPELGMESLLARRQAELLAQQQRLEASRAAAAQLIADWVGFQPVGDSSGVETLVGVDRIRDRRGLTPQERETLRLLEHGHTDETIAKRLGVSTRTTRRTVAGIMDMLGARSRFQAGATASQRGWLSAPEHAPDGLPRARDAGASDPAD
ncbi:helix-turn-helix transcriptional regulator [Streptomyces roseolus]|nr:helix-turn-helix transcriptional regulator [Streptomyces roseolus]GGR46534.1 hypothetical protein GCM10010282_44230 [Streptomyces roseolus]